LGRLLFSGEAALKKIEALSGGESARLLLAKLLLCKHNVLVLDEPTTTSTSNRSKGCSMGSSRSRGR